MPTLSKFTEPRKKQFLEVLEVGGSRQTACAIAGFSDETLRTWLRRGEEAKEADSAYAKFREDVLAAEATPRFKALGMLQRTLPDNPAVLWKYIERQEPGYAPPQPNVSRAQPQVQIHLSLGGSTTPLPAWLEGEVVDAKEVPALGPGDSDPDQDAGA